ncbi:hypothetical protein GB937_002354 [Aspergillus fischeri]|nr:hypothetical protein GB937_002354 [Aspergillus fischeri]
MPLNHPVSHRNRIPPAPRTTPVSSPSSPATAQTQDTYFASRTRRARSVLAQKVHGRDRRAPDIHPRRGERYRGCLRQHALVPPFHHHPIAVEHLNLQLSVRQIAQRKRKRIDEIPIQLNSVDPHFPPQRTFLHIHVPRPGVDQRMPDQLVPEACPHNPHGGILPKHRLEELGQFLHPGPLVDLVDARRASRDQNRIDTVFG